MSEPDIRKVVSELEGMLRRGIDHIDCDASDIRVLLSALDSKDADAEIERLKQVVIKTKLRSWNFGPDSDHEKLNRLREAVEWYGNYDPMARDTIIERCAAQADDGKDVLIRDLVAALKSIDSEMDDTDHKFATRMFKAGEIIDATLTRAKEAGYE